jgi:peroxiredoxin Q/BCP
MLEEGLNIDFCLSNQDNTEICLRDLRGKWVVVFFYPKDMTPGCTKEACEFSSRRDEFEDIDAVILGISGDSVESHLKFIEKENLSIILLSDKDKSIMSKYGIYRIKKMYGKESMGVVRTTVIISPDGVVKKIFNNVKVDGHIQKVKDTLIKFQS